MSKRSWFEVDRSGLAEIAKRRGMAFIVTEPIQNAWDEASENVSIELTPLPGVPRAVLEVRDDSPQGFRDLADSYMMFRPSYKLGNPEQRGRFNVGEKLLLSVAHEARVMSTTGTVIFGERGRTRSAQRTEAGSVLRAELKMTRAEVEEALARARMLIPPRGIRTTLNGVELPTREPLATTQRRLGTEVQGPEGGFKYVVRQTEVRVYECLPGEKPHVYEMGIPIDEIACPWHVEVMQKVPLSLDRSSLHYGYQQEIQAIAGELMAARMTAEQSQEAWVTRALESMEDDEAVRAVVKARFGNAVIYDMANPESNKLAVDAGYKIVHGAMLSKKAWAVVRRAEALKPAGKVFDSGKMRTSPDGEPPVDRSAWTDGMQRVALYAQKFALHTCDAHVEVEFYDLTGHPAQAFCGQHGLVAFNSAHPEMAEILAGPYVMRKELDQLLIHECAHLKVADHLTHAYHQECCRIGAALRDFHEYP